MASEVPVPERLHDAVVVGGGLCGLVAATQLHHAGADVVVLEASGEVGGRTRSRELAGRTVDMGGELVGKDYVHLRGLVAALGLRLEPAGPVLSRVRLAPRTHPPLRPTTATGLAAVAARLNHLCTLLPAAAPWKAPQAPRMDAVSLGHWLETAPVGANTARLLGAAAQAFSTAHPRELSLLAFLTWLKPAGGRLGAVARNPLAHRRRRPGSGPASGMTDGSARFSRQRGPGHRAGQD
ncbi:flavin monoamine oxidase family protein [Haloactinospora alba]|uniref:flavin monoamine oxidase family protein n=1 Tax=Haloactinospora alba TaxID=405555 RepID=UPI0014776843|nr:FAD-dependent oxidoreductase [Haloactinospora alba]